MIASLNKTVRKLACKIHRGEIFVKYLKFEFHQFFAGDKKKGKSQPFGLTLSFILNNS